MKRMAYPLFACELQNGAWFARVLGVDIEMAGADLNEMSRHLEKFLERRRREGKLPDPPFESFKMRAIDVEVRPSYREEDRVFAAATTIQFPVQTVWGMSPWGLMAILPLFQEHFYFHSTGQLRELTQHFVRERLYGQAPETIHRYITARPARLLILTVKDKENPVRRPRRGDSLYATPRLDQIATRLPPARREPSRGSGRNLLPDSAFERAKEFQRLADLLTREKASVLVVGEPGSGKSNLIRAAIRDIHRRKPPRDDPDDRPPVFWRTTPHRLTAEARYLGDWQQICEEIVNELRYSGGVLYLIDFLNLFVVGGEGPEDSVAAFLRPFLAEGTLRIVGEVTPSELDAARRILPEFSAHFQTLFLDELDDQRTRALMGHLQSHAERTLRVNIRDDALDQAQLLLKRYLRYEKFPGKAVHFLSKLLSDALLEETQAIDRARVTAGFMERTGLPEILLRDDLLLKAHQPADFFEERIKGQADAIRVLASVVRVFKVGLNNPERPIASLLFAGPTGTGKTASARALAGYFFGAGNAAGGLDPLIRIDMSEYQHPAQLDRLIGDGRDRPGKLVERLRERPFAVVLLDEIEKAHPVFFDVLLSVLDQGRLTDAFGRVTDFRGTIIVMTSNLGAAARPTAGFATSGDIDFLASIREFFRPEFFNRIDEVVVFGALSPEALLEITRQELDALNDRDGLKNRGLRLEFSPALVRSLAERGYEPRYGARPLARLIEREVIAKLARHLLANRKLRDQVLRLDYVNEKVTVN